MTVRGIGDGHTDDSDVAVWGFAVRDGSLSLAGAVGIWLRWRDVAALVAIW